MINFDIGRGTRTSEGAIVRIDQIAWGEGSHHVQLEININGTGWTNMGTTELLSVPYALFAGNAVGSGGGPPTFDLDDGVIPVFCEQTRTLDNSNMSQNADGNIVIGNNATLQINDYIFPETRGFPGQILMLNATADSLIWVDNIGGGGGSSNWERDGVDNTGNNLRNSNSGSVVVMGRTTLDPPWPATAAQFHVERGDFVVNSSAVGATSVVPFNFTGTPASAGMMWWGGNQAFRVGRVDNNEALTFSEYEDAWDATNIGINSIGIGTNVVAKSDGAFGFGRNLHIDANNAFSMGIDNMVRGVNSMTVGQGNRINTNTNTASIVGRNNQISGTDLARGFFHISGHNNTIGSSLENVFILGRLNTINNARFALALGQGNSIIGGTGTQFMLNNAMAVLIGRGNIIEGEGTRGVNNILIGIENVSDSDSVIALGTHLRPSRNSILIGQNILDTNGTENRNNIAIGQDINIHTEFTGLTQAATNNIFIGNSIENRVTGVTSRFSAQRSICIGNNIQPHATVQLAAGFNSINIGNDIITRSENSINIGNIIEATGPPAAGPRRPRNTIAIGHNITFPDNDGAGGYAGSRDIDHNGTIVIGTNFPRIYPNSLGRTGVVDITGGTGTSQLTSAPRPRFVVGGVTSWQPLMSEHSSWNPAPRTGKQVHYLYIDDFANAYFGFIGPNLTQFITAPPLYTGTYSGTSSMTGGTIFCRQVVAVQASATWSDRRMKKNERQIETTDLSNALLNLQAYSYNYNFASADPRVQWGFMAQDVLPYFPHLVQTFDGEELLMTYQGFIPILWKINQDQQIEINNQQIEINNQQTQIDAQRTEIEELKNQIEEIRQLLEKLNQ
jgi:hypothetical protein